MKIVNSFQIETTAYYMDNTNCLHVFDSETDEKIGVYAPNTSVWQKAIDEALEIGIQVF